MLETPTLRVTGLMKILSFSLASRDISRRSRGTKQSLLQVGVLAVNAGCDGNDVGLPIDNVDQPS